MLLLDWPRIAAAAAVLVAYAGMCWGVRRMHRTERDNFADGAADHDALLVAYASQTGNARTLAQQAGRALEADGQHCRVVALERLDSALLARARRVLFVISTSGEGEPPDHAHQFERVFMRAPVSLEHLEYGLLALGDRAYARFCAFGRRLDGWLMLCGATPLFPRIEADALESAALARWQTRIAELGTAAPVLEPAPLQPWRLRERRRLNPGSDGAPVCHIELEPASGNPCDNWEAGDLIELHLPDREQQRPRLYSIASLPQHGSVQLLVRAVHGEDGRMGRMSGLLIQGAQLGSIVPGRIRPHPRFRSGHNAQRPMILVGNGTGLAGLLAHLRQRAQLGQGRNWLVFGERQAAHDALYHDELQSLARRGLLSRYDRTYSRDDPGEYVQHRLATAGDTLRHWLDEDAAIYICGTATMGEAVHALLRHTVGDAALEQLIHSGRYCKDLY